MFAIELANTLQVCFNVSTILENGGIYTIQEQIQSECIKIEKELIDLERELAEMPEGTLICARNGKYHKWYQSAGHTKRYIPKCNRKLAEQLAVKKYLTYRKQELEKEYQFLTTHFNQIKKSQLLLENNSEYQALLSPYFKPISEELSQWIKEPYERNQNHPEQLLHKSISGNILRSKSESMVDTSLFLHKIPFRYECALTLGETTIFPDFTIRHPKTGETIYWEHFGLIDNPNYSKNAYQKMQLYTNYGIIPSYQLITTFETKEQPLTGYFIEKVIEHYFL